VKRWKTGDILWAENDFVRGVYVVASDPRKVGTLGFHGPDEICVEFISEDQGHLWDEQNAE
jgi:hypothetical protein